MKIFEGKNVPIKSWCNNPEEGALQQAYNLSSLPFIFKQVNLMPDTHQGYGMPIGGVIATKGVVIPNAVGVDIGCGMCAVKTGLTNIDKNLLDYILCKIREVIPVGKNHQTEKQSWCGFRKTPRLSIIQKEWQSAHYQLGTLGGGNHFIEIQKDSDGIIWIMLHSGSRNFGYKIAKYYNKKAQELCTEWYSNITSFKGEDGLAFLPLATNEGQEYLEAMTYAVDFAYANRKLMMERIIDVFVKEGLFDNNFIGLQECRNSLINIAHNYAAMEHQFGKNVMVHRKGATSAKVGQYGIIPGSQGTSSYIVIGKGNPESFNSCSHGAGRKMSRKKARNELNLEEEKQLLESQGIIHSIRTQKDLDEASSAYKDIDLVMEEQKDLVDIVVKLQPLAVIKG